MVKLKLGEDLIRKYGGVCEALKHKIEDENKDIKEYSDLKSSHLFKDEEIVFEGIILDEKKHKELLELISDRFGC